LGGLSKKGAIVSFLNPIFLWLLIPTLLLLKNWDVEASSPNKKVKNGALSPILGGAKAITSIIILILIILALSRPSLDNGIKEKSIESKNIIIALDASYSMRATDIEPNRYDFAKQTIEAFLKNNPKANITLLAFTQNPLLLSPPTTDHQLINIALKALNPDYILTKGTSLESLFRKAASLKTKDKNLLLISDGGEEQEIEKLKEILNKNQIDLSILAMGTRQGATIKSKNGLLKDKEGHLVVSAINPILKELTSNYTQASSSPQATAKALENILNISHKEKIKKLQHSYQEFYQLPLLLATILFFMLHTKYIRYIFILFALFGVSAEASILDGYNLNQAYKSYQEKEYKKTQKYLKKIEEPSLESVILSANNHYRLEEYKKAIALYQSIRSTSIKTKQRLYYNIGNAYAKLEQYKKAKESYTHALQLGKDRDSLYNLKHILFKESKKKLNLGIANPKSQSSQSSKSENQKEEKKIKSQNSPSSASGNSTSGENSNKKAKKEEQKRKLLLDPNQKEEPHPLSSKVYELINKGYIYETKPW
jgi:Ca-activated chloride channel family protein